MREINSVSLIGLGAIGATYGSMIQDAIGDKFKVIANQERLKRYQQKAFQINNQTYHFTYHSPKTITKPADLLIVAVKNTELTKAMEDAKAHIGPNTIILSLLNGISNEEIIEDATKNDHILYSMCVGIDAERENQTIHYGGLGKIVFGERNQTVSEDAMAVKKLFDQVGIPYEISENIWRSMWQKFMLNVGANQTSVVLKAPYTVFQTIPAAYDWVESAMYEVVNLSRKEGVHLERSDVENAKDILNGLSPEGKTSMLQDIEARRKTEVEFFAGKVCELGEKHQMPTPVNDQLYKIIRIMEEMNKLKQ